MNRFTLIAALAITVAFAGCGEPDRGLKEVTGSVKYNDGRVPAGEIAVVTFTPDSGDYQIKGASGDIKPDGTFQLTTSKPGDGAFQGKYKVVLQVFKTYADRELAVDERYTRLNSTPFEAEVGPENNHFDFVLE
jgi:hypothetical protein